MTLRTAAPRIDPVAVPVDGEMVVTPEHSGHCGKLVEAIVAGPPPRVLEDHDGRGPSALEIAGELRAEGLDARIRLVMEEVEVVEEARGLAEMEAEEGMDATSCHVHHLHRPRPGQRLEIADERGDAALLVGYPWRIGRVHALGGEERHREHEHGEAERPGQSGRDGPARRLGR